MHGAKGSGWSGGPGGKFSLGRLRDGSGYCVGAVVETRMGVGDGEDVVRKWSGSRGAFANAGGGKGEAAGNGMRGVWVLGEGFFRGVGGVFDVSCPFTWGERVWGFADERDCSSRSRKSDLGRIDLAGTDVLVRSKSLALITLDDFLDM